MPVRPSAGLRTRRPRRQRVGFAAQERRSAMFRSQKRSVSEQTPTTTPTATPETKPENPPGTHPGSNPGSIPDSSPKKMPGDPPSTTATPKPPSASTRAPARDVGRESRPMPDHDPEDLTEILNGKSHKGDARLIRAVMNTSTPDLDERTNSEWPIVDSQEPLGGLTGLVRDSRMNEAKIPAGNSGFNRVANDPVNRNSALPAPRSHRKPGL